MHISKHVRTTDAKNMSGRQQTLSPHQVQAISAAVATAVQQTLTSQGSLCPPGPSTGSTPRYHVI